MLERPLATRRNNKFLSKIKDRLNGQIMKEFAGLIPKMYSYIKDIDIEKKS